jgi:transcription initiation factor TFIIIB Brf1 subunit/transcription initiation factor TFIIB
MDSGKNFDSQNLERWCGCKNSIRVDNGEGEIACQECGVILNEDKVDRENNLIDQTQDNVHQSPVDYTEDNRGLGGNKLNKEDYKKIGIKNYDDYSITKSTLNYDEVKCNNVFQEIKNICKKERYSKMINNDACIDYKKMIEKHGFQKYKNNKMLAATSILRVCKNSKVKINISKVSKTINEPREKLVKCYNDIHKKIYTEKPNYIQNSEFNRRYVIILGISKMASILGIPQKLIRQNLDILDNKKFELIISGSDDESISAGIIEFICRNNNFNLKTKNIAKKLEISENTIRNQAKKISTILGIELGDKRKKRG